MARTSSRCFITAPAHLLRPAAGHMEQRGLKHGECQPPPRRANPSSASGCTMGTSSTAVLPGCLPAEPAQNNPAQTRR